MFFFFVCLVRFFPHLSSHPEIKAFYSNNQNIQLIVSERTSFFYAVMQLWSILNDCHLKGL